MPASSVPREQLRGIRHSPLLALNGERERSPQWCTVTPNQSPAPTRRTASAYSAHARPPALGTVTVTDGCEASAVNLRGLAPAVAYRRPGLANALCALRREERASDAHKPGARPLLCASGASLYDGAPGWGPRGAGAAWAPQFLVSWGDPATVRFARRLRVPQEDRIPGTNPELAVSLNLSCLARRPVVAGNNRPLWTNCTARTYAHLGRFAVVQIL